jgi:probable phosphomutase (TIGR03848 family)
MAKDLGCEVVLVRHAHSTANLKGVLAGRDNRVGLSPRGRQEALELAAFLSTMKFDAIFSSPLRRCLDTLAPYLAESQQKVTLREDLIEMEYGRWSGKSLSVLSKEEMWKSIQSRPSTVRFPGGESFGEMSLRANQVIWDEAKRHSRILVLSHGDVIKAIAAFHLGSPLDSFQRISIDPASVSIIRLPASHVITLNSTSHLKRTKNTPGGKRDRFQLGGGQGKL